MPRLAAFLSLPPGWPGTASAQELPGETQQAWDHLTPLDQPDPARSREYRLGHCGLSLRVSRLAQADHVVWSHSLQKGRSQRSPAWAVSKQEQRSNPVPGHDQSIPSPSVRKPSKNPGLRSPGPAHCGETLSTATHHCQGQEPLSSSQGQLGGSRCPVAPGPSYDGAASLC